MEKYKIFVHSCLNKILLINILLIRLLLNSLIKNVFNIDFLNNIKTVIQYSNVFLIKKTFFTYPISDLI